MAQQPRSHGATHHANLVPDTGRRVQLGHGAPRPRGGSRPRDARYVYMWRWKYVCAYVYIHVMYTYMVAGQAEVRQERLHGMQGMRMCVCGFMCVHMCSVWMYVCAYV